MITFFSVRTLDGEYKIKIPLSSFNCFVGLNGSGKTTILEMITFTLKILSGSLSLCEYNKYKQRYLSENVKITIRLQNKNCFWDCSFFVSPLIRGAYGIVISRRYVYNKHALLSEIKHKNIPMFREFIKRTLDNMFICDEIENGLDVLSIEPLIDELITSGKQVLFTTHSPLILNFLHDEIAKESVHLIFSGDNISSTKYFDHPVTREKLNVMGPGEVFIDTDIQDVIGYFKERMTYA